jgi:hypothetical protein
MKTKIVVVLSGVLVALLLLSRYFALSRVGISVGWMLYLGLPIAAGGVLLALRIANLGAGWAKKIDHIERNGGKRSRPSLTLSRSSAVVSERLEELQVLHDTGAISGTEYRARRVQIIAGL